MIDRNDTIKMKNKNGLQRLNRYWYFVIFLTFFLLLMVKFPLRIMVNEKFADAIFYGTISIACVALSVYLHRRFRKRASRLIVLTLVCSVLSGWQIFDLYVLQKEIALGDWGGTWSFRGETNIYDGWGLYSLRFPATDTGGCGTSMLDERYWGRPELAITVKRDWEAIWYACGG